MPSFAEDMQRGGAAVSFQDLGGRFLGNFGALAGSGIDALMASRGVGLAPSHYGPLAQQRFVEEMRMQQRTAAMVQQANSRMFGGRVADVAQGFFPSMSPGVYRAVSNYSGMVGGFLGLTPREGFSGQGTAMLSQLSSRYSGTIGRRAYDAPQILGAMEQVYGLGWKGQASEKAKNEMWLRNQRFGAGMSGDQLVRGARNLRAMGIIQAPTQTQVDQSRQWVDSVMAEAGTELLNKRLGGLTEAQVTRGREAFTAALASNKSTTAAAAAAVNAATADPTKKVTVSDMGTAIQDTKAYREFASKYGKGFDTLDPRAIAWAKQLGDKAAPMNKAFKSAELGGFRGAMGDYLEMMRSTFGQSDMMNPNQLRQLTQQIRATTEVTGKAFQEVAGFMNVLRQAPGGSRLSSRELTRTTQGAMTYWSEDRVANLSVEQRNAMSMWSGTNAARFAGSQRAGLAKAIFHTGTARDREIMSDVAALDPQAQREAYSKLISTGKFGDRTLSGASRRTAKLSMLSDPQARAEFERQVRAAQGSEGRMQEELLNLMDIDPDNRTGAQNERIGTLQSRLDASRALGAGFSRQAAVSSERQLRARGVNVAATFAGFDAGAGFKAKDVQNRMQRAAMLVHTAGLTEQEAVERVFNQAERGTIGGDRVGALVSGLRDVRSRVFERGGGKYYDQWLAAKETQMKAEDAKLEKDMRLGMASAGIDEAEIFGKAGGNEIVRAAGGMGRLMETFGVSLVNANGDPLTPEQRVEAARRMRTPMKTLQSYANAKQNYKVAKEAFDRSVKYTDNRRIDLAKLLDSGATPEMKKKALESGNVSAAGGFDDSKIAAYATALVAAKSSGKKGADAHDAAIKAVGEMSPEEMEAAFIRIGGDTKEGKDRISKAKEKLGQEFKEAGNAAQKKATRIAGKTAADAKAEFEAQEKALQKLADTLGYKGNMDAFEEYVGPIIQAMQKQVSETSGAGGVGGGSLEKIAAVAEMLNNAFGGSGAGGAMKISGNVTIEEQNGKVVIVHKGTRGEYGTAESPAPNGKD